MKYAALAAALAAVTLPEASGFSASGALPLRGSQLPSSKVCLLSCSSPALVAPAEAGCAGGVPVRAVKADAAATVLRLSCRRTACTDPRAPWS
jgi:hypothetical protein